MSSVFSYCWHLTCFRIDRPLSKMTVLFTYFSDLMTYQAKKFISWSHSFGKMIKENDQLNSWINQRCKSTSNHPFSAVLTLETGDETRTDLSNKNSRNNDCSRSNSLLTKRITGNITGQNDVHPIQDRRNSKKPQNEAKQW